MDSVEFSVDFRMVCSYPYHNFHGDLGAELSDLPLIVNDAPNP